MASRVYSKPGGSVFDDGQLTAELAELCATKLLFLGSSRIFCVLNPIRRAAPLLLLALSARTAYFKTRHM